MDSGQPARVEGAFHWKAGGWFGAQVGSTFWLVVLGVLVSWRGDSAAGTAVIALAVAANGIGLILWEHRGRLRPYPAMLALVGVVGAAALVAFALLDRSSLWTLGGDQGPRPPYAVLFVFPAMMGFLALQEHTVRRMQRRGGGRPTVDGGRS